MDFEQKGVNENVDYRDCIIVYKSGQAIILKANRLAIENEKKFVYVYDNENVMAIVALDEIKTVLFADTCGSEMTQIILDAINGVKDMTLECDVRACL